MTSRPPLISVIIPAYNYGRFLPDAVKSVLGQKKDGLDVEIIVVDDGSTDDTAAVAQRLGSSIQYIYQENQGLSAARNAGIRAAHGDYLVFLDADDLLTSRTLASHLDNFTAHPELDVSVCLSLQTFSSDSGRRNYLWPLKCAHLDMHLCHSNISPVHTFMLRAEVAQEIGFFNPDLKACEDQDYWLRCAALGKRFGVNSEGLVIYRQHGQSMTSQMSRQLAHDAALRFKISRLLETRPDFPRAGKFYGWLAHACGTLDSAYGIARQVPQAGKKLVEESAKAMLCAAAAKNKAEKDDLQLLLSQNYFIMRFLLRTRAIANTSPTMQAALTFLQHRYPHLVRMCDMALNAKSESIFFSITCKPQDIHSPRKGSETS